MLLWSVVVGVLGVVAMLAATPVHWPIMPEQAKGLRASLTVLEHGGPLLLGRHSLAGKPYAVGTAEEGIYVYFPLFSHLLGVRDPVSMVRYFYVALFGLSIAVYPLVFYRLTRSLLAGIIAPLALHICARSFGYNDVYWVPAWVALTLLPLVYLLDREWPRLALPALMGISLVGGWASSIRADSGLAVVIATVAVVLLRRWRWWRIPPAVALLLLAYLSIGAFVLPAVREHRDDRVGASDATVLEHEQSSAHIWHTAYIGLGYLPNDYDICYEDRFAIGRVQRDAPGTRYLSNRYNTVLRSAYFGIVRRHPVEVIKQYAAKLLVTTADTAPYLLIVLLTMPAMLLLDPERRIRRRWILLTLPAIVVAYLPPMIAIPNESYEQGLYGVLGVIGILGVCWCLERTETAVRGQRGLRPLLARMKTGWSSARESGWHLHRQSIALSAALLTVVTALVVGRFFVARSAESWQGYSSEVVIAGLAPAPLSGRPLCHEQQRATGRQIDPTRDQPTLQGKHAFQRPRDPLREEMLAVRVERTSAQAAS
jgi:hypothetical protein